jgi:4-amino-4-deoxy-L-arabinose transferase-like glycosyltransferase
MNRLPELAAVGLLLALSLLLFWTGLGRTPLNGIGEAREGLEVQEELVRGEWILPMRNGTELPSKPPLFHWRAGFVSKQAGRLDETTLRIPSAA